MDSNITKRAIFIEDTYSRLNDCCEYMMHPDLNQFEENRARKLLNFCRCMCQQFKDDERFGDLLESINFRKSEFSRFTESNEF